MPEDSMTIMVSRQDNMSAFTHSLELDDVQTPARYFFLLCSITTTGLPFTSSFHRSQTMFSYCHQLQPRISSSTRHVASARLKPPNIDPGSKRTQEHLLPRMAQKESDQELSPGTNGFTLVPNGY